VPAFVVGAVLFLMTMGFLVLTATTDPGIVPSNRGMEQAEIDACAQAQRTVEINGVTIQLKWCRTCHIFRPPRAAHCSECNVCVERFDHHCPWMGQCIGRRNYRFFLGFVNSCCLLCSYTLGLTCVFIYRVATMDGVKHGDFFSHAMARAPAGVAIVAFCALILLCVGPLACYHYSLVCSNKTTSEEIKELYTQSNPFDRGVCGNCNEACCVAIEAPRLQPRALVTEPKVLLVDDPNTGLDPLDGQEVYDLINACKNQWGFTGLVISHELPEVFQVSERVAMILGGKIIAEGTPAEMIASPDPAVQQFLNGRTDGPIKIQ
jgi:hypothetical protein